MKKHGPKKDKINNSIDKGKNKDRTTKGIMEENIFLKYFLTVKKCWQNVLFQSEQLDQSVDYGFIQILLMPE